MSKRFHINEKGVAAECSAQIQCRLRPDSKHFDSEREAYAHYEQTMAGELFTSPLSKTKESRAKKVVGQQKEIRSNVEGLGIRENNLDALQAIESPQWSKNEAQMLSEFHEMALESSTNNIPSPLIQKTSGYHFSKEMLSDREKLMLIDMETLVNRQLAARKAKRSLL